MVETRRSSIIGPDGQPIMVPLLKGETAAPERYGARALIHYSEASGLTPARLGEIMKSANMGLAKPYLTLAIDMEERYLHYASQLQTRRLALDGVTISVSAPKGVNAKTVDFVESLIADPMFPDMVASLQDGVGKGYSVVEPIWEYEGKALRPVVYQHRDPRYFRYDEIGLRDLCLLEDSGLPGPKIEAPYFIKHEPYLRAGTPVRRGVARSAAWAFVMQTFALQDWAAFCEIYGIPFRIGKYHSSATTEDKATLLRAVRAIANDAAAIIPQGMEIDFQETNGNRGEAVFGNFISYLDGKVSLIILGQTMTAEVSKSGGSLAQAKVQENVRMDIVRFDARQNAATVNRDLIRPAVAMNFGPQEIYPKVEMELSENEDLVALGTFIEKAQSAGLKIGQKYLRKRASIPEPDEDEELLTPPGGAKENGGPEEPPPAQKRPSKEDAKSIDKKKVAAEQLAARDRLEWIADQPEVAGAHTPDELFAALEKTFPFVKGSDLAAAMYREGVIPAGMMSVRLGCSCATCAGAGAARFAADDPTSEITALDDTDALVDEALSDWREIRDPLLAGLLSAVGQATTFEEALANIEKAKIDSAPLEETLARAAAKSRGLGDVRD